MFEIGDIFLCNDDYYATIIEFNGDYVTVSDMNGDCFDVPFDSIEDC